MPDLKTYDLFVSHAWFYSKGYNRLIELLKEAQNFNFRNYSVPKHDPAVDPNNDAGRVILTRALDRQIQPVNIVLVMAGMYANYKYWIQKEIELANNYSKPIIGLVPWGQERTPITVQNATIEMINWNSSSIVSAIRNYSI